MAFMSGTLESVSLYNCSQQSRDGEPVYSKALCSRTKEFVSSTSHCCEAGNLIVVPSQVSQSHGTKGSQAEKPIYTTCHCSQEPRDSVPGGHDSLTDQDIVHSNTHSNKSKATSVSNERCEMIGNTDESLEQMGCVAADQDQPVHTPLMVSTSSNHGKDGNSMSLTSSDNIPREMDVGPGLQGVWCSQDGDSQSYKKAATEEEAKQGYNYTQQSSESTVGKELCNITKKGVDLSHLCTPQSQGDSGNQGNRMLSEQCFQAAISEGFGSAAQTLSHKVRPVKRFSYHVHNRLSGSKLACMGQKWQLDQNFSHTDDMMAMSLSHTVSSVNSPSVPSSSGHHHDSQDTMFSDNSSQNSGNDVFDRKYRYNHTALALQQSGLMKTTIKTAEVLNQGKILQAELTKLRKETALLMRSVLSNPENKHFRELYMQLHQNKLIN